MKRSVAVFPYMPNTSTYIGMMTGFLQSKYDVINYYDLKRGIFDLEDIDAIYLNWIEGNLDETDIKLLNQAKSFGINIVWVFHNRISHESLDEKKEIEKAQYLVNVSTNIILHSRTSIRYLEEFVPELDHGKIHYIPHPEFIGEYYSYGDIAEKYNISEDELVFGIIGYIGRQKNIETLIKAFKNVKSDKCRLIIAGSSNSHEYVDRLRNMIKNDSRIILVEQYISSAQMNSFLSVIDILVLPYNKRSCMNSGAMMMSFSYGMTVITTDIAMADDFDEGLFYKYHYTSEDEHIHKLTEIMEEIIASGKAKIKEQGNELQKYVCEHCSKEIVKNELYKIIEQYSAKEKSKSYNCIYDLVQRNEASNYRSEILQKFLYTYNNIHFKEFFASNHYQSVAVYGYGVTGRYLVDKLLDEDIHVPYIIDRNAAKIHDIKAYSLEDDIPMVDVVIITANGINTIKDGLRRKGFRNIISVTDILKL